MKDKRLVFNGIDGLSGTYGQDPKTVAELANQILGGTSAEGGEHVQLRHQLKDKATEQIMPIIRSLIGSSPQDVDRDVAWEDKRLEELARLLAETLVGADGVKEDQIEAISANLQSHTVEKIVVVVKLLIQDETEKLLKWLLNDQDRVEDDKLALKERLKQQATSRFNAVQTGSLTDKRATELEGDSRAQRAWLATLIDDLYLIPIDALNALSETEKRFKPLGPLIKELDTLTGSTSAPILWLETLRQDLYRLREQGRPSWNDLLKILYRGLKGRVDAPENQVSWTDLLTALSRWFQALRGPLADLHVAEKVGNPADLSQAGWGIIFPYEDPRRTARVPIIKKKLQPLLDLREEQAGERFHIYEQGDGYWPGDTARTFLTPHGATPDQPVDPDKVPYYLLIVGSPDEIPFHFQYQLDVQYAVGRIDFGDDLDAYANYAHSIVAAERQDFTPPSSVAFFGPANPGDTMTDLAVQHLIQPLHQDLVERYSERWEFSVALKEEATRSRLGRLLGGEETPALLFAACHGMEFDQETAGDLQEPYQGALLCQEWRGPVDGKGKVSRDYYLAGKDLGSEANLLGMVALLFACYSAGTPRFDEFYKQEFKEHGKTLTERPFLAALPKAMLSQPNGGALAVIGHIERVWGTSFLDDREQEQIAVFRSTIERLLKGQPVGLAMEYFNGRYAALSTELNQIIQDHEKKGKRIDPYELARIWTANNDARGYIIVGDPAVRLPVAQAVEAVPNASA